MKKILSIFAIIAVVISISSCGNKKKKTDVGTHTHEDGTVYRDDAHSHDHDAMPAQESFEVKADNDAEHKHEGGDADLKESGHDHEAEHGEHK